MFSQTGSCATRHKDLNCTKNVCVRRYDDDVECTKSDLAVYTADQHIKISCELIHDPVPTQRGKW